MIWAILISIVFVLCVLGLFYNKFVSFKHKVDKLDDVVSTQTALNQTISRLEVAIEAIKTKLAEETGTVKESLSREINETRRIIENLKTDYEARKPHDKDLQDAVKKIELVLVGGRTRGESGENVLRDALKHLPPNMIEYNFKVRGKPVEYALILPNQKKLPIDSKWPAYELLERLSKEEDLIRKKELEENIEKALIKKIKEVTQYIDPATTTHSAIAAIPDAVFAVCRKAHAIAFQENVILMPYSMTIPYLLNFYKLHEQYSRSIDIENLEGYLDQLEKNLTMIDKILENSISRGATMVSNAYSECKKIVGDIKGTAAFLRALPQKLSEDKEIGFERKTIASPP